MFSLASKHNDPNASLAWSERIGYGTGGFAFNMINGIIGSFLTIYFTSTVGLNAGIIATIFAISKVFDGISDVIVGRMVDRTKFKTRKRPFLAVTNVYSIWNHHHAVVFCTTEFSGNGTVCIYFPDV